MKDDETELTQKLEKQSTNTDPPENNKQGNTQESDFFENNTHSHNTVR